MLFHNAIFNINPDLLIKINTWKPDHQNQINDADNRGILKQRGIKNAVKKIGGPV
jgi:hypothetical protein